MGLFDKRTKKMAEDESASDVEKETAEAEKETAEAEKPADASGDEPAEKLPTRFTMVVENTFTVDENESIAAVGNLHGRIEKGAKFFIIHPKFPNGLEAAADTLVVGAETPDEANECRLAIKITSIKNPADIPKYAVISNVAPQVRHDPSKPLENPFLVGLTMEYDRLAGENEFTYTFMVALLTSRYITPAEMELEQPDANGKASVVGSKIRFRLLRHPNNKDVLAMPVFTDSPTLQMWKGALDAGENGVKPKTLLLPFERCAEVAMQNGGMVINPFGPSAVFISKNNIQNTLNLGREVVRRQQESDKKKGGQ